MRQTITFCAFLSVSLCASSADAQRDEGALRSLERRTTELRAEVNRSFLRMRILAEDVLGDRGGAQIRIEQRDETGPLFRLVAVTYSLDGHAVRVRRDPSGELGGSAPILDGAIGPGEHTLGVVLRYEGDGLGVTGYMPGYHFVLRSSYSFVAPPNGERLRIVVRPYSRGPLVPYADRLGIEYERP